MSEDRKVQDDRLMRWVTFHLDGETYGINVDQVREVLRLTEIAPVPGAPDYVLGIINLRGNVVTVIDTRKRFSLEFVEATDSSRIVIIEVAGQEIGMLVDSVAEVVDLAASAIEVAPNIGNAETSRYIQGVTSIDGRLLILIDVNKFLDSSEMG
ncbi:MAG: chemotaxis protein CheW [Gammaproteobacteria bacterium]|nr:chemotaxis protein CheW [Gammaproteobacteria bacterium]